MPIKQNDIVTVISGFYKNKTAKVIKVNRKKGTLVVQGVNLKYKHIKSQTKNELSQIKQFEFPIHHSNVKINLNN